MGGLITSCVGYGFDMASSCPLLRIATTEKRLRFQVSIARGSFPCGFHSNILWQEPILRERVHSTADTETEGERGGEVLEDVIHG